MKDKILISLLVISGALVLSSARAQIVDSSIIKSFHPAIVVKVYDIVSKTKKVMPLQRQKKFANYFKKTDSLVVALIASGSPKRYVDSIIALNQSGLDSLFTAKEKFDYYTSPKLFKRPSPIPFSQLSLVIKYKDSLGLSDATVNKLLMKLEDLKVQKDNFYKSKPKKSFDSRDFECKILDSLLTENQYTVFLKNKNKNKAENYALNDWKELVARNLASNYSKDTTIQLLTSFYLARQNVYDRYFYDKIKLSANLKIVADAKPTALRALIHARRNPSNDTEGQSFQF